MKEKIIEFNNNMFEDIKHIDEFGEEFWSARELVELLGYTVWSKAKNAIEKAIAACTNSGVDTNLQFAQTSKLSSMSNGAKRIIDDYKLTRYACYLVAQNSDSRKKVVALAQTYFAVQTRKQEIYEDNIDNLSEDEKRVLNRNKIRKRNGSLNKAARDAGVKNFDRFHNAGYKGLYNGETANDIAKRKNLLYRQDILDYMSSEELILNLFRISQTEQKLKKDKVNNEYDADATHYNVGKEIRNTLERLGSTMPEDMPTPIYSSKATKKKIEK